MFDHLAPLRSARRLMLASIAIPGMVIIALMAAPKSTVFADPGRLAVTATVLAVGLLGSVGFILIRRRYSNLALFHRFAGATGSMKDTLNFIVHERRLSGRWRVPLIASAWIGFGLSVLAAWPQCIVIEPARGLFQWVGAISLVLLALQPFYARAHVVNKHYLHRYLRQQAAHNGYISARRRLKLAARSIQTSGETVFEAGGFRWCLDDFYKNALVLGQPGSGKTVCVLNALLEKLITSRSEGLPSAGVILDPKGSYRDIIGPLCDRLGRSGDLYILSPSDWKSAAGTPSAIAWNPYDTLDDSTDVASRTVISGRLVGGVVSQDTFFADSARIFIRHAFVLWRAALAPEPASPLDVYRLCRENVDEPELYKWLVHGLHGLYPDSAPSEIEAAIDYFENEWRRLPEKQRAGVQGSVTQLLDDFTQYPFDEMMSGRSTVTIADVIDNGKILYVHMPLATKERLSKIATSLVKLEFQREILRRVKKQRPSWLLADEFQSLFVAGEETGDSFFFEKSRESRHANVVAAQNVSSFLKKTSNRHEVTNFLGLCAVKIFLRNAELETNRWAADLFGERSEIVVSMSEAAKLGGGFFRSQTNYSRATRSTRVISPDDFARLSIPLEGDKKRHFTASIVHLGSRDTTQALELTWPVRDLKS